MTSLTIINAVVNDVKSTTWTCTYHVCVLMVSLDINHKLVCQPGLVSHVWTLRFQDTESVICAARGFCFVSQGHDLVETVVTCLRDELLTLDTKQLFF